MSATKTLRTVAAVCAYIGCVCVTAVFMAAVATHDGVAYDWAVLVLMAAAAVSVVAVVVNAKRIRAWSERDRIGQAEGEQDNV